MRPLSPAPVWTEEELRVFCRATLRAFPRHGHHHQDGR